MRSMTDEGWVGFKLVGDGQAGHTPPHPNASGAHLLPRGEKEVLEPPHGIARHQIARGVVAVVQARSERPARVGAAIGAAALA